MMRNIPNLDDFFKQFIKQFDDMKRDVCHAIDVKALDLFTQFLNLTDNPLGGNSHAGSDCSTNQVRPVLVASDQLAVHSGVGYTSSEAQSQTGLEQTISTADNAQGTVQSSNVFSCNKAPEMVTNNVTQANHHHQALIPTDAHVEANSAGQHSVPMDAASECLCAECNANFDNDEVQFIEFITGPAAKRQKTHSELANSNANQTDVVIVSGTDQSVGPTCSSNEPQPGSSASDNEQMPTRPDTSILKTNGLFCFFSTCEGILFVSRAKLNQHLMQCHGLRTLPCALQNCRRSFSGDTVGMTQFLEHLRADHPNPSDWQCTICSKSFAPNSSQSLERSYSRMGWHMSIYHSRGHFECAKCPYVASYRFIVMQHYHNEHGGRQYDPLTGTENAVLQSTPSNSVNSNSQAEAQLTEAVLVSSVSDQSDILQAAPNEDPSTNTFSNVETPFRCTQEGCGKTFQYEHQYNYHKKLHLNCRRKNDPNSNLSTVETNPQNTGPQ